MAYPAAPRRLIRGQKVGIISPAGRVRKKEIEGSIELIRSFGLEPVLGEHVHEASGYLAGTDTDRIRDLHSMFRDKDIRAIFCTRGGYGSLRLLEHLDYELIKRDPKILVGYSDITALLIAINSQAGLITFHGPVLRTLGFKKPILGMLDYLTDPAPIFIPIKENDLIKPGSFSGRLFGGNLTILGCMAGIINGPVLAGKVLFFEDVNEPIYRLDRSLTCLRLQGAFEGISGILLGDFIRCGPKREVLRLFRELCEIIKVPCVSGLPVGHGRRNITIPIGAMCSFDMSQGRVLIESWEANGG